MVIFGIGWESLGEVIGRVCKIYNIMLLILGYLSRKVYFFYLGNVIIERKREPLRILSL